MFRIAASPARSQDTWSLATTTTERSEMVGLILILHYILYPTADWARGTRARLRSNPISRSPGLIRWRPMPGIVAVWGSLGNVPQMQIDARLPAGLVSHCSKGYNGSS